MGDDDGDCELFKCCAILSCCCRKSWMVVKPLEPRINLNKETLNYEFPDAAFGIIFWLTENSQLRISSPMSSYSVYSSQ